MKSTNVLLKSINNISNVLNKKDLIIHFVKSEIKVANNDKLLGKLWSLLDPLFMMVVYSILVVVIFKRGGANFPILLFSALISWRWFNYSVLSSVKSVSSKASIIKSVKVPLAIFPVAKVLVGLYNYGFALLAVFPMLLIFHAKITANLLWLPLIVFIQFLLTMGFALALSIMGVYFKDIENIAKFTLRAWFYLSPALYSVRDRIPEEYVTYFMLNPFSGLFESYKNVLVRGLPPDRFLLASAVFALVVFVLSLVYQTTRERDVPKEL